MKRIPNPFSFEAVDAIELDVRTSQLGGHFSVVSPDRHTTELGSRLTEVLTRLHVQSLKRSGKEWNGQFTFMPKLVIRFCEFTGLNPAWTEAVRRGWIPYGEIPIQFADELDRYIRGMETAVNQPYHFSH